MAHDVFISYSTKDKAIADAVCAGLEAEKIRCWIAPRDILPGVDWGEAIIDAIEGSKIMVLILSSISNNSEQVKREIQNAVDQGLSILPIRIEELELSKSLRYFLGTQHWLDAVTPPMDHHIKLLAEKVKALLSKIEDKNIPDGIETPKSEKDAITTQTLYDVKKEDIPNSLQKVIINAEELREEECDIPLLKGYYKENGKAVIVQIYCNKDTISIGRGPVNDLVIIDTIVSRKHCCIQRENDIYKLMDLESTSGTRVNKVQIKEQELKDGDIIEIGSLELTFIKKHENKDIPEIQMLTTWKLSRKMFQRGNQENNTE